MEQVCTVGPDIAKNVFQVQGVDDSGAVVLRRQVRRRQVLALFEKLPACLVGIEACATAHYLPFSATQVPCIICPSTV